MNDKIKIRGLGSIVLLDEVPIPDKDYLISIRAALSEVSKNIEDSENPVKTYIMKYLNTEQVSLIGSHKVLEVQRGKTPSQVLRFVLEDIARLKGEDEDSFYKGEMSKIIEHYKDKLK